MVKNLFLKNKTNDLTVFQKSLWGLSLSTLKYGTSVFKRSHTNIFDEKHWSRRIEITTIEIIEKNCDIAIKNHKCESARDCWENGNLYGTGVKYFSNSFVCKKSFATIVHYWH